MVSHENVTHIALDYPVTVGGAVYNSLSLRRPTLRDIFAAEHINGDETEKEIYIFANLCEISTDVIESLDIKDYSKLKGAYQSFLL